MTFPWEKYGVTPEDKEEFVKIIGSEYREPDLIIADGDGADGYLWRWWVVPPKGRGSVYAHIQIASDPARPLHTHPWDNMSVVLAGGYIEQLNYAPWATNFAVRLPLNKGETRYRRAEWAHRLILPPHIPYTMTLFSSGPKVNHWGFWHDKKFHPYEEWVSGNPSVYHGPKLEETDGTPDTVRDPATAAANRALSHTLAGG